MASISGVWSSAAAQQSAATTSSASSSSSAAAVTANEFLTLLVTELKNQDPTNSDDPKEYINQLVGINSLEQLVSINQNLQSALSSSTSSASSAG